MTAKDTKRIKRTTQRHKNNQKIKENLDKIMLKYHKDVLNNPHEHTNRPKICQQRNVKLF